jgi:hypothetical protein
MAEAAKSLKEMWVLGTRQMVSERRGKTARFLAQLKDQSSDYAKAHHAVIAECDKMLSANEMAEMLSDALRWLKGVHDIYGAEALGESKPMNCAGLDEMRDVLKRVGQSDSKRWSPRVRQSNTNSRSSPSTQFNPQHRR